MNNTEFLEKPKEERKSYVPEYLEKLNAGSESYVSEFLEKLNTESRDYVPDIRNRIVTRAKAEGLLELEKGEKNQVYNNGNTAVAGKGVGKAIAITILSAVAALGLIVALPAVISKNCSGVIDGPGANVDPGNTDDPGNDDPGKEQPRFPDAPVMEEMGLDYSVGAVSTVKLMQQYADSWQPAAKVSKARAAVRSAESGIENFGIYFSAFDSFFSKDLLTSQYHSHAGEHYDKTATIFGKYADGVAAEFIMNYCEALDINTSTEGVYNYYLEGYITFAYNDYALAGWRTVTVNGGEQTQTSLEISAYPNFNDKTTYAKMQLTDAGYEFTVVTGGETQSEAVMRRSPDNPDTAYIVDIKGGNGGTFTVGLPSGGRSEVPVDYACGDVKGQFFADKRDKNYNFILCDYLIYKASSDGSYWSVTGLNEDRLPEDGKVLIPAYVQGKPVKEIAASAFSSKTKIKSVIIPDCVERIGTYAFSWCSNLTEIVLPSGLKELSSYMCNFCSSLESIKIPETVETISSGALANCTKLTEFNIPASVKNIYSSAFGNVAGFKDLYLGENVEYVSAGAFASWDDLQTITLSPANTHLKCVDNCLISSSGNLVAGSAQSVIPSDGSVTSIGERAFNGCKIECVNVPASVEYIGYMAFYGCDYLAEITLPDTNISIGQEVFNNCAYYSNRDNWENGALYISKHLIAAVSITQGDLVIKPGTLTIIDYAIRSCQLNRLVFDKELLYIGRGVLHGTVAAEISFDGDNDRYYVDGNCLLEKGDSAVIAASINAVIPDFVTRIETYAFNGYNKQYNSDGEEQPFVIPASVNMVEPYAITGGGYGKIVFESEMVVLDSEAFAYCSVNEITFNGRAELHTHSFQDCTELHFIEFKSPIMGLSTETFDWCPQLGVIITSMTSEHWLMMTSGVKWYDPTANTIIRCSDEVWLNKFGQIEFSANKQ